jgi:hypothetical protein
MLSIMALIRGCLYVKPAAAASEPKMCKRGELFVPCEPSDASPKPAPPPADKVPADPPAPKPAPKKPAPDDRCDRCDRFLKDALAACDQDRECGPSERTKIYEAHGKCIVACSAPPSGKSEP